MHVPAVRRIALAIHQQPRALRIAHVEVIASHFVSIPPAGLDAFGAAQFLPVSPDALRAGQQPQRALDCPWHWRGVSLVRNPGLAADFPGPFGPVILDRADAEDLLCAEPRTQALD